MPDLTDVRKNKYPIDLPKRIKKKMTSNNADTSRNVNNMWRTKQSSINTTHDTSRSNHRDSDIRDVIKDLIVR